MIDREEVVMKAYGKQSVYVIRQDNLPTPSSAELDSFDEQLKATKEDLFAEREKTKTLQSSIFTSLRRPTKFGCSIIRLAE